MQIYKSHFLKFKFCKMWIYKFTKFLFKNSQNLIYEFVDEQPQYHFLGATKWYSLYQKLCYLSHRKVPSEPFSGLKIILYASVKQCSEQPEFVFSFSFIFGCSLTVFSVHLDASPWNLEFFWFTRTSFFVHQKNSRFQGSASRFTEKTVSSQPKMQEKQKKTSGVSLHSFPGAYKIFFGRKMARKEQFRGSDPTF